ncbi:MAG TPA: hypothetical protein ENI05_03825 [Porticoccus sp.]|nr:hypothetical protein [Porticoccus sp.]
MMMTTNNEIKVLDRLDFSGVRLRTDWDREPEIKATFLFLEKDGHIERDEDNLHGFWRITESGTNLLKVEPNA